MNPAVDVSFHYRIQKYLCVESEERRDMDRFVGEPTGTGVQVPKIPWAPITVSPGSLFHVKALPAVRAS